MNYFQRMMLHKGMEKRCPIRLSMTMIAVGILGVAAVLLIAQLFRQLSVNNQEPLLAALEAQKDRDELLAVLEGRRTWITADGQQYARVEWVKAKELVK